MLDSWSILADVIRKYERDMPDMRATPAAVSANEIRRHLSSSFDFVRPHELSELIRDVAQMFEQWNVQTVHPRHFGLFTPTVRPAGIAADTLTALFNPNLGAWWYAAGSNEIEIHTLKFFLRHLGFDPETSAANFSSGGAEANHSAVLVALTKCFPTYGQDGLNTVSGQPTIYLSEEAHDCFSKIAHQTGIGRTALRRIRTDAHLRLDLADLARRIDDDRNAGKLPFLVVATAGTTGAGAIDPLPQLGDFCRQENLWFHVDAAWGGGALLSRPLRHYLEGIQKANSVTWDAHKWLPVPVGAGMFFCTDQEAVSKTFCVAETAYLSDELPGTVDQYKATMQWSRRFIGLKVFMTLAELGSDGIAALIDHQAEMADELRTQLRRRGWQIVAESPLPLVCFTHPAIRDERISVDAVIQRLLATERLWLSKVILRGEAVLRACITSYRTGSDDLNVLVEELEKAVSS